MKVGNNDLFQTANQLVKSLHLKVNDSNTENTENKPMQEFDLSAAGNKAIKLLEQIGVSVSKEDAVAIDQFMQEAEGSIGDKLIALSEVISKQLPLDTVVLGDMHQFRQSSLLDFILPEQVQKSIKHKETEKAEVSLPKLKVATQQVDKLLEKLFVELEKKPEKASKKSKTEGNKKINHQAVKADVSTRADDDSSAEKLTIKPQQSDKVEVELSSEEFVPANEQVSSNSEAIDEAFIDSLQQFVSELSQSAEIASLVNEQEDISLSPKAQMFLEEKITPRLAAVKQNFETLKNEISTSLKTITSPAKEMTLTQKSDCLAKVIDKLDNAIMRSEVGLYIDMSAEKKLLKQSSSLADARALLNRGDVAEAEKIVQKVVQQVNAMEFRPSIQKAIAVANPLTINADNLQYKKIVEWARMSIDQFSEAEKSPAVLVNYLRRLGINHEVEAFQKHYSGKDEGQTELREQMDIKNLKSLLLDLAKDGKQQQNSAKLLSQINGQQLNLKLEDKVQTQQLALSIPSSIAAVIGDVKVFIKSQQDQLKVDWRNFNMLFIFETKAFGELGVKVNSVDKNLSIEIKNNNQKAKTVIEPLAEKLRAYVEEVGFNVASLNFNKFRQSEVKSSALETKSNQQRYHDGERTFDFQI